MPSPPPLLCFPRPTYRHVYIYIYKNFIKKLRKTPGDIIILYLCTNNLHDMIYSSWDIECDRLKLVIVGHSLPFTLYPLPLKTQKNENFEKIKKIKKKKQKKNCWRYHHFTQAYQKPQSYEVQFLRYGVRLTEFFVFLGHFFPLHPPNNQKN